MEGKRMAKSPSSHPALSYTDDIAASWTDVALLAGRIFLGGLFLASRYGKLGSIPGTIAYFTNLGMSPAGFWAWFAGCAEVVLGAALILGIATRYTAIGTFVWGGVASV